MEKAGRPRTALNESVKVVVRCRPLSDKESLEGYDEVVKVWPDRGAVQVYNPKGQDKLFTYDAAYDCDATTQTIYDEMIRPLVASVLDGFNGCVFAYGQTGTGKTHTMEGTPEQEGIIPRAFRHIWEHIENNASPDVTYLVSCSYVELYLEEVRDLLSKDNKKLTIKAQELSGFYIPELSSVECRSAAGMARVLRAGGARRAAAATDMNAQSSRSHAVFQVTVETAHRRTNKIRVGKLNLVDLAGSERQRKTQAANERLKEATRINQALSSLGNVISALAENSPHVPYRDSKLTRILQDSLGGNSKTIMVATIGPAAYNYDETLTTLRYAHRAKAIKNKPIRNEDPKDAKLREYQAEIERLRTLIQQRQLSEKRRKPARTRDPLTQEKAEDETASIESEHILAESTIEAEKCKTEELEQQIRSLEDRLVQGGGGKELIDDVNEAQLVLEQRRQEIAERRQREVEMQQRIELEEETAAIVTNTFATLQQEVDHKTQRLKKCMSKYLSLREEVAEQRDAHDAERRDLDARLAALAAALRRRLLLADSFVRDAGRGAAAALRCSEEHVWLEPAPPEPLQRRPLAGGGRRPTAADAAPRRRPDNTLQLHPLPLPPTTRPYPPPPPPSARPPINTKPVEAVKQVAAVEALKSAAHSRARRPLTAHRAARVPTAGAR